MPRRHPVEPACSNPILVPLIAANTGLKESNIKGPIRHGLVEQECELNGLR